MYTYYIHMYFYVHVHFDFCTYTVYGCATVLIYIYTHLLVVMARMMRYIFAELPQGPGAVSHDSSDQEHSMTFHGTVVHTNESIFIILRWLNYCL